MFLLFKSVDQSVSQSVTDHRDYYVNNTMILCYYDTLILLYYDTMILWYYGTMIL